MTTAPIPESPALGRRERNWSRVIGASFPWTIAANCVGVIVVPGDLSASNSSTRPGSHIRRIPPGHWKRRQEWIAGLEC